MSLKRSLRSSARASIESSSSKSATAIEAPLIPSKPGIKARQRPADITKSDVENDPTPVDPPSTPPSKRAKLSITAQLPNTPTHIFSNGTVHTSGESTIVDPETQLSDRPAEPHRTNATLKTPGGSRLVPFSKMVVDWSPTRGDLPEPTTTTQHLLEQACAHLIAVDPRLKPLIERHHCHIFSQEGLAEVIDPFESLCSGIVSQQVSGAAAKSIKDKFVGLFQEAPDGPEVSSLSSRKAFPKPSQVVTCSIPFLRTAGLSERKAEYIKGLAEKFHCGELSAKMLIKASDEEVLEKLVSSTI